MAFKCNTALKLWPTLHWPCNNILLELIGINIHFGCFREQKVAHQIQTNQKDNNERIGEHAHFGMQVNDDVVANDIEDETDDKWDENEILHQRPFDNEIVNL